MTDGPAIEAVGLEKSYGPARVLAGVDLRVAPGSVFSLLGPNGAGKTTTVRILSTLMRPDAGRARTRVGASGWQALAWCVGILLASGLLSALAFRRRTG
jgi:ABC-type multidrug transport system ATPase subunit